MEEILKQIEQEYKRQMELWGCDFDDCNTANDWVAYITRYVAEGAYDGRKQQYTLAKFREHLVKAATLCVSAIDAMDRNNGLPPRHYDKD